MPHSAAYDLCLHFLLDTLLGISRLYNLLKRYRNLDNMCSIFIRNQNNIWAALWENLSSGKCDSEGPDQDHWILVLGVVHYYYATPNTIGLDDTSHMSMMI